MTDDERRSVTRRECDIQHDSIQKEIESMKGWLSKIDNRLWAFGAALVLILIGTISNIVLNLISRVHP
jgi:hypothetical protein